MRIYPSEDRRAAFVSLERGEDLLQGLTRAVAALGMEAATVQVLGALEAARVGYFDQDRKEYVAHEAQKVEIASGVGNVSIRDGEPWIHLHLVLSGPDGACLGGHAMEGCRSYAVEAHLRALGGPAPVRVEDPGRGLKVWPGS